MQTGPRGPERGAPLAREQRREGEEAAHTAEEGDIEGMAKVAVTISAMPRVVPAPPNKVETQWVRGFMAEVAVLIPTPLCPGIPHALALSCRTSTIWSGRCPAGASGDCGAIQFHGGAGAGGVAESCEQGLGQRMLIEAPLGVPLHTHSEGLGTFHVYRLDQAVG